MHWVWAAVFFGAVTTAPRTSAGAGWDPEDRRPARVAAEVGGGAAATALGGVIGGFIGAQTCDSNSSNNPIVGMMDAIGCSVGTVFSAFIGGYAFMGVGVWGTGTLAGGNGGVGYTYLGEGVGVLGAGTVALFLGVASDDTPGWVYASLFVALPLAGAVFGYELSTEHEPQSGPGSSSTPLTRPAVFLSVPFSF